MKRTGMKGKRALGLLLAAALLLGLQAPAWAAEDRAEQAAKDTGAYLCQAVKQPQVGSGGGEWAVIGLARSGCAVPEGYYRQYYAAVEAYVKDRQGRLHERKYTEYSRLILALSAIGKDPRDVAGYDLTLPLGDYDQTVWQGINGPVWALLALDSRQYPMPQNPEAKTQATRQMYVDHILDCQLPDGGWSLTGQGEGDPDITGMALQALAKYRQQPAVDQAIRQGLDCMSRQQDQAGGFSSWGTKNAESCVQMLIALCELDIPLDDPRFVKNGNTLLDSLLAFYTPGQGFRHAQSAGNDQIATEQGLCALAALLRQRQGDSLYRMGQAPADASSAGLAGKNPAVKPQAVTRPGKSFADVPESHADCQAIRQLASRGIIDGKGQDRFCPADSMTRAEFAAIAVRALGLEPKSNSSFSDVTDQWFAPYVGAASDYGLIQGVGQGRFDPNGTITRQQAAVMVARAAELCGLDTRLEPEQVRQLLARFADYEDTPAWSRAGLALCCREGILDDSSPEIQGGAVLDRGQIAQMLYRLLQAARLL